MNNPSEIDASMNQSSKTNMNISKIIQDQTPNSEDKKDGDNENSNKK